MNSRPRALLLDVMSTLVYDPFYVEVPAFFGMSFERLLAEKHPTSWVEFERDEIDEATMLRRFFLDERPVGKELVDAMVDAYRWLDGIPALLEELSATGVPMFALSNYPRWYGHIDDKLGLARFLDDRFVSWRTGLRKPDPAAYEHAARELGVAPADCVFVDDRPENCRAAEDVGMEALRYTDTPALVRELRRTWVLGDESV